MKRIIIATSSCPGTGLTTFGENAVCALGRNNAYLLNFSTYLQTRPKTSLLGKSFKEYSSRGEKVPDEIILPHIKSRLVKFIADKRQQILFLVGVPRTQAQAETLMSEVTTQSESKLSIEHLFFHLEQEECERRMMDRGRKDDTPELIKKRITEFGTDMESTNSFLWNNCSRRFEFLADELKVDYYATLQLLGLLDDDLNLSISSFDAA